MNKAVVAPFSFNWILETMGYKRLAKTMTLNVEAALAIKDEDLTDDCQLLVRKAVVNVLTT